MGDIRCAGATNGPELSAEFEALLGDAPDAAGLEVPPASVQNIDTRIAGLIHAVESLSARVDEQRAAPISGVVLDSQAIHELQADEAELEQLDEAAIAAACGVSPAVVHAVVARNDRRSDNDVVCWNCNKKGHRRVDCKELDRVRATERMYGQGNVADRGYGARRSSGSRPPMRGKTQRSFSSNFGRTRGFETRRPYHRNVLPRAYEQRNAAGRFRMFAQKRKADGGKVVSSVSTMDDVNALPDNAVVFVVSVDDMPDSNSVSPDAMQDFDWA